MSREHQHGAGAARGTEPRRANRLSRESSPYLLQHAGNPVDWYAWGEEAFAEARRRDVPIFLSIGYSTCYWCHVMERESFEDEAIASKMNEMFVCVKVDREERPDVDDLYMTAVQVMTGSGGWPMSVFLEPGSLRPFWCGTYFPPESKYGRPGLVQILNGISEAWRTQRSGVMEQAEQLAAAVSEQLASHEEPAGLDEQEVAAAAGALLRTHDRVHGGFGSAPKFPQTCYLEFLLEFRAYAGDEDTTRAIDSALRLTLDRMALGGVFDQVGGGFHRYSTDEKWLVPHFEKMLYDQGQLAEVYAKAAGLFGDPFLAGVAKRTCEFAMGDLRAAEAGDGTAAFYSALDAEVDHREGLNYLWTPAEFEDALGADEAAWAMKVLGVSADPRQGNFRDPHHPGEEPTNVLSLGERPAALAARLGESEPEFQRRLDRVLAVLREHRSRRDQPGRDEKILAAWNGLMIAGLAATSAATEDVKYLEAAESAAKFVLRHMREVGGDAGRPGGGGLLRSCVLTGSGAVPVARVPAFLDDYACMIHGLVSIVTARRGSQRAGNEREYFLEEARRLTAEADARFGDPASGGYFDTLAGQADLFVRARSKYDGAIPSAGSIMLNNLLDLHELTGEAAYAQRAGRCLASMSAFVANSPVGGINSTRALLRILASGPAVRSAALSLLPAPDSAGQASAASEASHPVAIYSAVDTVVVGEREPAGIVLKVKIDAGYHVNAAEPGDESLIGFRVAVVNGSGVVAFADYPSGTEYRPAWNLKEGGAGGVALRVYTGEVSIPVILERRGEWKGKPLLAVTYQACRDDACLAPATVELDVAIDRG
ncbi:MAG: thioredoxin domain-containing protein [Phycisphaerales bacterium]